MIKHKFTFPKELGGASVVMRELTAEEVLQLLDAFAEKPGRLGDEMVKMALVSYGAKDLSNDPIEREKTWASLGLKQRSLITAAYQEVTTPTDKEVENFFSTHESLVE
jgi:hypothetical protein